MDRTEPDFLVMIAGNGVYPRLFAESAREHGVQRLAAIAFRGETDRIIERYTDEVRWITLGCLGDMLAALKDIGAKHAVMVGQITPTHLFTVRLDRAMLDLLKRVRPRNAHTIFGAVAGELDRLGMELIPASTFMDSHMPEPGVLTKRSPTPAQRHDIELGIKTADAVSGLEIGQTVAVKDGVILAVEAFEGTNAAIMRAAKLAGPGIVAVKRAKPGHDMRFDIPVAGVHTMKVLKKAKAAVLALEAGRSIVLERDKVVNIADRLGICITAEKGQDSA